MPAFTPGIPDQHPLLNSHVKEWLEELRRVTGQKWVIVEVEYATGMLWWKKPRRIYQLFCAHNECEAQIINFYVEHDRTINHWVGAETVVAYMMGACNRKG